MLLLVILIASDLLIGFFGHYSGSTDNEFTIEAFGNYLQNLTILDLLPVIVIALIVVILLLRFG